MSFSNILKKLFKNEGAGPEVKDTNVSKYISIQDWSSTYDYSIGTVVRGSNSLLYWSVAQSGPSIAAGAQDPTADATGAYWMEVPLALTDASEDMSIGVPLAGDSDRFGGSLLKLKSDGNFLLKMHMADLKDGQLFSGVDPNGDMGLFWKTQNGKPYFVSQAMDYGKNDGSTYNFGYSLQDKNGKVLTTLGYSGLPSNRSAYLRCYNDDGDTTGEGSAFNGYYKGIYVSSVTNSLLPVGSGIMNLGLSNHKWSVVYATTGTINTSDERLKSDIEPFPDEVLNAWGEVGFVQYKLLESIVEKGQKDARLHSGLIAQRIDEAFRRHGLDASRYGLFCWNQWDAEPETAAAAGEAYSLRYDEALCMEAAYQRKRADRAEARIAALEARLTALEAKLG